MAPTERRPGEATGDESETTDTSPGMQTEVIDTDQRSFETQLLEAEEVTEEPEEDEEEVVDEAEPSESDEAEAETDKSPVPVVKK